MSQCVAVCALGAFQQTNTYMLHPEEYVSKQLPCPSKSQLDNLPCLKGKRFQKSPDLQKSPAKVILFKLAVKQLHTATTLHLVYS